MSAPEKVLFERNHRADVGSARRGRAHFVAAVMAAIAVGGCASLRQSIGGRSAETPPTPAPTVSSAAAAAPQGQTYYAAVGSLPVRAEPSKSSKVVGQLALYEKVTRYKIEGGYAYVTADKSGLKGWVDNSQLLWRVPASTASGATERAEPSAASSAPTAEPTPPSTAEAQAPPTAAPTPTSPPTAELTPTSAPTQAPTRTVAKPVQYQPF